VMPQFRSDDEAKRPVPAPTRAPVAVG